MLGTRDDQFFNKFWGRSCKKTFATSCWFYDASKRRTFFHEYQAINQSAYLIIWILVHKSHGHSVIFFPLNFQRFLTFQDHFYGEKSDWKADSESRPAVKKYIEHLKEVKYLCLSL